MYVADSYSLIYDEIWNANKLQSIDKNISGIIAKEAKAKNYDIVLAKGVVLYGGADITGEIAKLVK